VVPRAGLSFGALGRVADMEFVGMALVGRKQVDLIDHIVADYKVPELTCTRVAHIDLLPRFDKSNSPRHHRSISPQRTHTTTSCLYK
jgi:hypothetical protein